MGTVTFTDGIAASGAGPYGFCTLAQLKRRLNTKATDTTDDALLQQIINDTALMIENAAGRRLRRDTDRVEYFNGGSYVIRTSMEPIVSVSAIRESATWDFATEGAYKELVDKADYILMSGFDLGHKRWFPGGAGAIRRLTNRWLGDSGDDAGQVQVTYTAGYYPEESVPGPDDGFYTPFDLRHANLLQAAHEYQTRQRAGLISQAMRGMAAGSGASYMKTLADLLPEVLRVAASYRRLY